MEYIIISIIILISLIILKLIFNINVKSIKKLAENKELDELIKTLPDNSQICSEMLKMLKNENVIIQDDGNDSKTSLYLVLGNKIIIGNIKESFIRIQTIAHECLHSIQDKSLLMFNFIFSNIYLIYFLLISILTAINVIKTPTIYLSLLIFFSLIYCTVRNFLETDAMTKAKYVAKDYLENKNFSSESTAKVINEYEKINNIGIKAVNYTTFMNCCIKILIFSVIVILKTYII